MTLRYNDEQCAILDHLHYKDSQVLAANALAGTGKTTTLVGAAQYPLKNERLRYFVFNRRNADEAEQVFPANTEASTAHSMAFRAPHPDGGGSLAEVYGNGRLFKGSLYGPLRSQLQQSLEFKNHIRNVRQELRCSEGRAIMAIQAVLRDYCQSADPAITARNIPPDLNDYLHRTGVRQTNALIGAGAWTWDRMRDPFGTFPVDHSTYLKLCSLSPPRIAADTILFDEAQDASPPMLEILKAQLQYGTRIVLVGDTYQHIYDFTGAVDAMADMKTCHPDLTQTLPLTVSYRFGQEIADAGNHFLRLMGSPYLLTGKGKNGAVQDDGVGPVNAVLFRGNATLLNAAVSAVSQNQKIHVTGGTGDIVKLLEAMSRLYRGEFAKHPELGFFDDWQQLRDYAESPIGGDMAPSVRIVEQHQGRVGHIIKALQATEETPHSAQFILSTGHKSKGGQWPNVALMNDFQRAWMMDAKVESDRSYQIPGGDALALQYVACTRAMHTLYTNGLLNTMERALREEQAYSDIPKQSISATLEGIERWKHPPEVEQPLAEAQPPAGAQPPGGVQPATTFPVGPLSMFAVANTPEEAFQGRFTSGPFNSLAETAAFGENGYLIRVLPGDPPQMELVDVMNDQTRAAYLGNHDPVNAAASPLPAASPVQAASPKFAIVQNTDGMRGPFLELYDSPAEAAAFGKDGILVALDAQGSSPIGVLNEKTRPSFLSSLAGKEEFLILEEAELPDETLMQPPAGVQPHAGVQPPVEVQAFAYGGRP